MPVMLGVSEAMHCRSEREKERQGELFCRGGGNGGEDDPLLGDFLLRGCRGGRQRGGDNEFDRESSLLFSLPMLLKVTELRLKLAGLFKIPPSLLFKG